MRSAPGRLLILAFPGQGTQYVGMGRSLYRDSTAAKHVFETANEALGMSLTNLMFEGDPEILKRTENAQPAILVHSVAALAMLNERTGFNVDASTCESVMGHSLGEYTALVAANVLDLEDGVRLARERGLAMARAASGTLGFCDLASVL